VILATDHRWETLLSAMPLAGADAEVILHRRRGAATATLRSPDAPPRTFRHDDGGVRELQPACDESLPGADLVRDAGLLAPLVGEIASSRVVAWRPGRRLVLRVRCRDGVVHWLKLLDRKSFDRATNTFHAIGRSPDPMRLSLPSHLLPEICGYLTNSASGEALHDLLAARSRVPVATLASSLLALATTEVHGALPTIDFSSARAAALAALGHGVQLCPSLADLEPLLARITPPPGPQHPGFVHGDLHDKQLFLAETSTSLIDLEGAAVGDPRFDLVNLAEHVRLRDLQRGRRDSGLGGELLTRCGLDPDAGPTRAFRAVVRARLCGVYALRPRWHNLVDVLHTETLALLRDLP